jgi:NAD(P)-dependent dehydrogenase (short-subunit alcohol dehydrogenase family)
MESWQKTALVLGATGGLGRDVACRLLGLCSTLLVHGVDPDATGRLCAELSARDDRCRVVPVTADFASLTATRELSGRCIEIAGDLDIVVNAVDLVPSRSRKLTEDGNELTWQVNYLAPALIVLGLMPVLRRSDCGRIVHVVRDQYRGTLPKASTAVPGRREYSAWSYTECKLALMMLSQLMAARLDGSSCRSMTMQPAGTEPGGTGMSFAHGLLVDAVMYVCTSMTVPNGAYLRGRRQQPLPRVAASSVAQQRMWRTTCQALGLDLRTGLPLGDSFVADIVTAAPVPVGALPTPV